MNIKQVDFTNYKNEVTPKSQIYLHHTAGGPNAENRVQVLAVRCDTGSDLHCDWSRWPDIAGVPKRKVGIPLGSDKPDIREQQVAVQEP